MSLSKNSIGMGSSNEMLKNEWTPVVGGNRLDKPTFGEKFRYFCKRAFGFVGKLAGGLGWLFGPLGGLVGNTLYQLGGMTDRSANKQMVKKYDDMQVSEQLLAGSMFQGITPGFGNMNPTGGPGIQNFNTDGLYQERSNSFSLRSMAAGEAIQGMTLKV